MGGSSDGPATPPGESGAPTFSTPSDGSGTLSIREVDSGRAPLGPALSPGQMLAARFRICGFIARGGMGEVYEAEDLELGEHVALKTVRAEIAADPAALERFKTEVHLARKVTHPSACRIFDVFRHQGGPGAPGVTFLTMELLRGETLADRLARTGRLSPIEALPLVEQMASALEAAHRAGVIHRDFKCANVMLVPGRSGAGEMRAVVTDFGLARRDPAVEGSIAALTTAGTVAGTPAYMAPEQIEGGPITPATDIYALGVVMYEMLTGRRPFEGETPMAAMVKRLKSPPSSPRVHVANLDPVWESAVLRCLEVEPAKRFVSAGDLVNALRGGEIAAARAPWFTRRRLALIAVTGLVIAAAAIGSFGWWMVKRQGAPTASTRVSGTVAAVRRSVAVLGLRNLTGRAEATWLAVALAEMLTSELGAGEAVRTIPGEVVARLRAEVPFADVDSLARDTLARIRARLGSDLLVIGSYTALGDKAGGQIRLDVRLQDTALGETVASVSETGTETALFDLVSRTGARLRQKLGVGDPSAAERDAVRASLPQNPEAAKLYAEGLARLRRFDALGARTLLEKAKAVDPSHALTRAALSDAWSLLGYDARAREEAKSAVDLSTSLAREDRLSIEGRFREVSREWDKAIEICKTLFNFFPDNLEYGLRLASAEQSGSKGKNALDTLAALRKLPPPSGQDPRIDFTEAVTARFLSESSRGQQAASRAAAAAIALGAQHLVARARFEEGSNLQNLGRMDEAVKALEEAERLFREAGDRRGMAGSMNNRALVIAGRGDLDAAEKLSKDALAAYREIGNKSGEALMVGNLGNFLYFRGDLAGARRQWEQTLPIFREINEKNGAARMLNNIASVLGEQGDIRGAREGFEQALAIWREVGQKSGVGSSLGNIARSWHQQGDLAATERNYAEAMAIWREIGDKQYATADAQGYGKLLRDKGDPAGARASYDQALAWENEMKQEGGAAEVRAAILDLDIDSGRAMEAEAPARDVLGVFRKLKSAGGEADAHVLLARIAAALGRSAEARSEADAARALAAKEENREHRFAIEIACARIAGLLSEKDRTPAEESLRRIQSGATRAGLVPLVFEARLALCEIEARWAPAQSKDRLRQLQKDAQAKAFGRVAARAALALK